MKKIITSILTIAVVLFAVALLTGRVWGRTAEQPAEPLAAAHITDIADAGGYVVKEYNGKIAVFTRDFSEEPAVVTEHETALLRAVDKAMLQKGVPLATYEEVLHLIEDFGP